jgi:hypothetical protein
LLSFIGLIKLHTTNACSWVVGSVDVLIHCSLDLLDLEWSQEAVVLEQKMTKQAVPLEMPVSTLLMTEAVCCCYWPSTRKSHEVNLPFDRGL